MTNGMAAGDVPRVVVTGLGVLAPNANDVASFEVALRKGQSGIRAVPRLAELGFGCRVAGIPQGVDEIARSYFSEELLMAMNQAHRYAGIAAVDAWTDAGLERPSARSEPVDWDAGSIFGTGIGGMDTIAHRVVPYVDQHKVRRLGSTAVEQVMASGISARVAGLLALGNRVSTNSSACSTGVEAIAEGFSRIRYGEARRMLCGGAEAASEYIWAGFDAMRVLSRKFNDTPERASRPMSASAAGFVPSGGAGALLLEDLPGALARGARIYAEVLGGAINCGGQSGGGSMTAPNPEGVRRVIASALANAGVAAGEVGAISGHLTATGADTREVACWAEALGCAPPALPTITSTKSLIGHALGAAGAIESVAAILMLWGGFVHPSRNCEDVHPEIAAYADSIPQERRDQPGLDILIKAGFGFGDVNACLIFRKWRERDGARPHPAGAE